MLASSVTLKDPGSNPVNSITDGSTASLPSSCSVNPAPKLLVNENSVVSSGWVSLIILIVPFLSALRNVQVTVSSGSKLIVATSPAVLLFTPVPSLSTQLTDWL